MNNPYREPEPQPDPPKVVDYQRLAEKHAHSATVWARISLLFAALNLIIYALMMWGRYHGR